MATRIKDLALNVSYLSYLPSIERQFLDLPSVINRTVNLSFIDNKLVSACGFSRQIKECNGQSGGSGGGNNNGNNEVWKEFGLIALKTAGISTVVIGGTALVVPALGFGASGVVAGTIAAASQSTFLGGTIAAGSAFSVLQSVGAAGLAASTKMGVVGVSTALESGRTLWRKMNGNGQSSGSDGGDNNGNNEVWKEFGLIALKTAGISTVVIGGTALVVPALGFGASGVGAGTIAAASQSTFLGGTIAAGSAFSVLQSVGAAGLAASTKMSVVGVSAALASGQTLWKKMNDLREKKP